MINKKNSKYSNLPFRRGVGMMILNKNNQIFVGKRVDSKMDGWQMPQGGIDLGETPSSAAIREMEEEIGSKKAIIISESKNWYSYRVPTYLIPRLWDGKYCGQQQKWFLMSFTGQDTDININTRYPEFAQWKWVDFDQLLDDIIPFKLELYQKVIKEFLPLLQNVKKKPVQI